MHVRGNRSVWFVAPDIQVLHVQLVQDKWTLRIPDLEWFLSLCFADVCLTLLWTNESTAQPLHTPFTLRIVVINYDYVISHRGIVCPLATYTVAVRLNNWAKQSSKLFVTQSTDKVFQRRRRSCLASVSHFSLCSTSWQVRDCSLSRKICWVYIENYWSVVSQSRTDLMLEKSDGRDTRSSSSLA